MDRKWITFVLLIPTLLSVSLFADTLFTPIWIPVRTGDSLAADFYSSDSTVAKPVIFIQTPYNKDGYRLSSLFADPEDTTGFWNFYHYNFVTLDWRGFYASEDAESTGYDRGLDGYDCIEWIAAKDWCDGNVGTYGGSALGMIQFQTARHNPPHLVCAAPWIVDYKIKYTNYYYAGVYRKEHCEALAFLGFTTTALILANPVYNWIWEYVESNSDYPEEFHIPMLLVSGWFDHYPADIIRAFHDIQTRSDVSVRAQHKLIMGPWTHSGIGKLDQGELEFPAAEGVDEIAAKRFFDYYLRGAANGYDTDPVGRFFLMGSDEWLDSDDWYSLSDSFDTLYLQPGNALSWDIPPAGVPPDTFLYDPRDPSPAFGGSRFNPTIPDLKVGPYDIRDSVEGRDDNVIFTTPVLAEDISITGPVTVRLYVSSNRLDTDFAVRLCDVYPDGRSMILTQGIHRMRFRDTLGVEELMIPGTVYPVDIEFHDIATTFLAGHRLKIVVTSAIYPHFDINLNNGDSMYVPGDTLVATNCVYHDDIHRSCVLLPITNATGIAETASNLPPKPELVISPNPFNSSVIISFYGSESAEPSSTNVSGAYRGVGATDRSQVQVGLEIFDINGRRVADLHFPRTESGENSGFGEICYSDSVRWPTPLKWKPDKFLGSGVYLIRVNVGEKVVTGRAVYLK
ncbi:hypothetical protein DRQ36_06880 [bacterium]|nr:MAG: hypothetical protein DRQ36_06880 [bacterium]